MQQEISDVKEIIPNCKDIEENLRQRCCILSREKWNNSKNLSKKKWEVLANEIGSLELAVNQLKSLQKKLYPDKHEFTEDVRSFFYEVNTIFGGFQMLIYIYCRIRIFCRL